MNIEMGELLINHKVWWSDGNRSGFVGKFRCLKIRWLIMKNPHFFIAIWVVLHFQRDQTIIIIIYIYTYIYIFGWWFGTFFIFPYIGNNHPNWRTHIFQRGWNHYVSIVSSKKVREVTLFTTSFRPHFAKFYCFFRVASDVYSVYNHNPFHIK